MARLHGRIILSTVPEVFGVVELATNTIALRAGNGLYLCEVRGKLRPAGYGIDDRTTLVLSKPNADGFAISTADGRYLKCAKSAVRDANSHRHIVTSSNDGSPPCRFDAIKHGIFE